MIKGDPKFEGIDGVMQLIYANMATIWIPQGGGHHGQIGIIMKPMLYTTLSTTAWANLPDPGV